MNAEKASTVWNNFILHFNLNTLEKELDENGIIDYLIDTLNLPKLKGKAAFPFYIMDVSGSMGMWEKALARVYYEMTMRILRKMYNNADPGLISFHLECDFYLEQHKMQLFNHTAQGGAMVSPAIQYFQETLEHFKPGGKYELDDYENIDVYLFLMSDGDNLTSDNVTLINRLNEVFPDIYRMHYVEFNQYNRSSTLMSTLRHLNEPKFNVNVVKSSTEVFDAVHNTFRNIHVVGEDNEENIHFMNTQDPWEV